jgi:hypothetical protein
MDMNDKTKKRLIISGGAVLCVTLAVLVVIKMAPANPAPLSETPGASQRGVNVAPVDTNGNAATAEGSAFGATAQPATVTPNAPANIPDMEGTEQSIQPEVTKPESAKSGETHEATVNPAYTDPDAPPANGGAGSSGNANTGGGLPGFDNVPDGGTNKGKPVDGEGDINKQIGIME